MHPRSAAEFLLAGRSFSFEAAAIAKLSSCITGTVRFPPTRNCTLLLEAACPVPARAHWQRRGPLSRHAGTDGNVRVRGSTQASEHEPADAEQRPKGKLPLQSREIFPRIAQVERKVRHCGSAALRGSARPVTGRARPRGNARQDTKGHRRGTADLSKKVHPRREVNSASVKPPARVSAGQLATSPSRNWHGTAAFIVRRQVLLDPRSSGVEAVLSGENAVVLRIQPVSPWGYNTHTALPYLRLGTAGLCALRRSFSSACSSCLRSPNSFCRLQFLRQFPWEGRTLASSQRLYMTQAVCRHAHRHRFPAFAPLTSTQLAPFQPHLPQLVNSTTSPVSEPVSPLSCLPSATRSLQCTAPVLYSRRSYYWFVGADKSSDRHWWQKNESVLIPTSGRSPRVAFPTVVGTATAPSHCRAITKSGAAVSTLLGLSTNLHKVTECCASALPAAAQPCAALRFAPGAAVAIPFRSTAAVAAGSPKATGKHGEPPQRRMFSSPAGRQFPEQDRRPTRPIRKLLIANRGEIAIRIHRACKEMGIRSVGVFSQADSLALHRQICDESYKLNKVLSPVGAYLNYPEIIEIALKHKVDAIHPGYGFLSENAQFAAAVEEAGLMLVGPSPRVIALMGDKVQARLAAVRAGVQAVPGTNTPIHSFEEASAIAEEIDFPIMLKAAYGGGGRGMRRVLHKNHLQEGFERAKSEAETAFGDGALFVEKLVEHGVHIEVQILADHYGDVVHLRERDCTVQRRHQKVVEIAPAPFLESDVRERILADAVKLMRSVGYQNAGTVEFLVERQPGQAAAVGAPPLTTSSAAVPHSRSAGGRFEKGAEAAASENDDRVGAPGHTHHRRRTAVKALHVERGGATEVGGGEEGNQMHRHVETQKRGRSAAYFIEVNPRLQVEHTVSEEVTGIDIVKTQIAVREGASLQELGITQTRVDAACSSEGPFALQCRITTEDSQRNFQPSTGRIELYQPSTGPGIRLDGAIGASGAVITPYYDSLLVKIIAKGGSFLEAVERARRALRETKIRGVTTNIPFILNVLQHQDFLSGKATTHFVDDHQMLLYYDPVDLSSQNICKYLAQIAVNGPLTQLVRADAEPERKPVSPPPLPPAAAGAAAAVVSGGGSMTCPVDDVDLQHLAAVAHGAPRGLKTVLKELGPAGFVKKLRQQKNVLLSDTTLRDAHQSLLATRLRTYDMVRVAPAYSYFFPTLFSLENWGGATFDVGYRFLRESPWRRLQLLREAIPNIPFQMLLRGANAVGYTAYADNVVEKFCAEAVKYGIDIFRVFDSLNYVENLRHGIHAAGAAGGVVEAAMVYTGNVGDPERKPYTLEYYLDLARQLVATDCHILCIKDMAGLLTPKATKLLVGSLRQEFPDVPIHVHTHDTAGCGVASMIAAAESGADVVDVAIDALAGLTSQPPMGAVVSALKHTPLDPGIDLKAISTLNDYFEQVRLYYAPFEATATLKSVSCDVYENEIPGGQYTNLHMQAFSLGLADQWPKIKAAYVAASRLLVVQYFQGCLGQPPFGFPEPLRTKILGGKPTIEGRPGAALQAVNWTEVRERLERTHGRKFREADLISSVLYPDVFDEFQRFLKSYGDVSMLPTPHFFKGILPGETITVHMAGREVNIKYIAQTHVHPDGTRDVFFNVMGLPRAINVSDTKAVKVVTSVKADPANPKHIGSPMPGNVLQVKVERGQGVQKGQQVAIISAMKMETAVVRSQHMREPATENWRLQLI